MAKLVKIGVALVVIAILIAIVDFAMNPSGSPVRTTLRTVRDAAVEQYDRLSGRAPAPEAAPEAEAPVPTAGPRPRATATAAPPAAVSTPPPSLATTSAVARPETAPAMAATAEPASPVAPAIPRRGDFYLPGRLATWTSYNVNVTGPIVIRAGGRVVAGNDATGPNGLTTSNFERTLENRRPAPTANQRVLQSAPYLALIGRICSGELCSDPFVVGSNTVVCPDELNVKGNLQLWTNNYIRVDGMQTSLNYSSVFGGYSFYVEPAPASLCGGAGGVSRAAAASSPMDSRALAAGEVLRNPEFRISSSQSSWKPFFLPLSEPLLLRANGSVRPRGGADATDPNGIAVPAGETWSYPGARDLVVDATHRLFDARLPYQALIGRLCGQNACGQPFLVGTERVICPSATHNNRLELWMNHIISPAGLLGTQTPLTLDAFDLQTRQGEYRFEVSRAPLGSCGG
jgi:hypothetical protein